MSSLAVLAAFGFAPEALRVRRVRSQRRVLGPSVRRAAPPCMRKERARPPPPPSRNEPPSSRERGGADGDVFIEQLRDTLRDFDDAFRQPGGALKRTRREFDHAFRSFQGGDSRAEKGSFGSTLRSLKRILPGGGGRGTLFVLGAGALLASTVVGVLSVVLLPLLAVGVVATFGVSVAALFALLGVGAPAMLLLSGAHAVSKLLLAVGAGGLAFKLLRGGAGRRRRVRDAAGDDEDTADPARSNKWKMDGFLERVDEERLKSFDAKLRSRSLGDVLSWSPRDVAEEMRTAGLEPWSRRFQDERIDGHVLVELTDKDLRDEFPDMSIGDRRRIGHFIRSCRSAASDG